VQQSLQLAVARGVRVRVRVSRLFSSQWRACTKERSVTQQSKPLGVVRHCSSALSAS
jgi:hypothetical protein